MAVSGHKIDQPLRQQIVRLLEVRCSRRKIAHQCRVSKRTVDKIAREVYGPRAVEPNNAASQA